MFNCLQALGLTPLCLSILSWKWEMTSALTSQRWGAGWAPHMVKEESTGKRGLWLLWVGTTWAQSVGRFRSCCDRCWRVCGVLPSVTSTPMASLLPGEGRGGEVKAKHYTWKHVGKGRQMVETTRRACPLAGLSWGQCSHRMAWIFRVSPYGSELYSLQRVIR